ncbi:MAG: hypothetical protein QM706_15690 [Nitrospira sp.]
MSTRRMFSHGLVFIAGIGLCAASSVVAETDFMSGRDASGTVVEVSGDQRIVEIDAADSSVCVVDSMVSGDQRRPDRHMAGFDGIPTDADECATHDYTMPMNR